MKQERFGMSKDSPFLTKTTMTHPSTKELLDIDIDRKEEPLNFQSLNKLPVDKQIKVLAKR